MAILPANVGIGLSGFLYLLFGLGQIIAPVWFLEQYKVDMTLWNSSSKLLAGAMTQFIGFYYFLSAGVNSINLRQGTADSKNSLCFMNAVNGVLTAIVTATSVSYWGDLGVPAGAIWFNVILYTVNGVVNALGCDGLPKKDMADIKKPLYWGFLGQIVLGTFYMFACFLMAEKMLDAYGFSFTGQAKTLLVGQLKYAFAPIWFYVVLFCLGQVITASPHATYILARGFAMVEFAFFAMTATWAAVWTVLNVNGVNDKMIQGQYFNLGLHFIFWILFYLGTALYDGPIKPVIEGGADVAEEKKPVKKDIEKPKEEEPVGETAFQIEPLLPLASNSVVLPSYGMASAYSPTTAYSMPTTTAYSMPAYAASVYSPTTTAYAAPATYSTGMARPGAVV